MGTSHRQAPVKALVGRVRAGLAELFGAARRLRGRARQRRHDRLLGRRGALAGPRARAAPHLRRVLAEVRQGDRRRRRSSRDPIVIEAEPGDAPAPAADPDADVIAWAHNETSTGVMVDVRRPADAGDALVLIDATSGAGGLPLDVGQADAYYFAPQKALRLRRRPLAGAAQPRRDRSASSELDGAADRWQPGVPLAADRARELAQGPDLQHARAGDPAAARRPGRVDARPTAASTGASSAPRASSGHLYGWAEAQRVRHAVRRRPGQALAGGRHDRLRRRGRRRRRSPRRCAPTASSTSSPTASSAATSCGSACSRRSSPADVEALTACIDWVVENVGGPPRRRARSPPPVKVLVKEKIADSGVDAAARALRRRPRRSRCPTRSCARRSATTTRS